MSEAPIRLSAGRGSAAGALLRAAAPRRESTRDPHARERATTAAISSSLMVGSVAAGGFASVTTWLATKKTMFLGCVAIGIAIGAVAASRHPRTLSDDDDGGDANAASPVGELTSRAYEPRPLVPASFVVPAAARENATPTPTTQVIVAFADANAEGAVVLPSEILLVRRARIEMKSGQLAAAHATLAEHRSLYPNGSLAEEAAVLRIEVQAERGERGAATTGAQAFMTTYPESAYAERVRSVLARLSAKL